MNEIKHLNLFATRYERNGYVVRHLLVRNQLLQAVENAVWEDGSDGGMTAAIESNLELFKLLDSLFSDVRNYLMDFVFDDVHHVRTYVMKGYDDNVVDWHNDLREGHNVTVAVHFSDLSDETGGHFQLQDTQTGEEHNVIPSKGLAVMFSHSPRYNHRVTPLRNGAERVAIFFDCIAVKD